MFNPERRAKNGALSLVRLSESLLEGCEDRGGKLERISHGGPQSWSGAGAGAPAPRRRAAIGRR